MNAKRPAPVFRAQRADDPAGWVYFVAPFALVAFVLLQFPVETFSFSVRESRRAAAPPRAGFVELSPAAAAAAMLAVRTAWQVGGRRGSSFDCDPADAVFDSAAASSLFRSTRRVPLAQPQLASADVFVPDPLLPPSEAAGPPPELPEDPAGGGTQTLGFSRSSMLEFEDLRPFKKGNRTYD